MDRNAAEKLIDTLALFEVPCGRLDEFLSELDGTEREKYKELVGKLLHIHLSLMMPVINQFPDLDPDGTGKDEYERLQDKYAQIIP